MITNPKAMVVLCYGDSNTFGQKPSGGRYGADKRWTGIAQNILGLSYYFIEEGLGSRTTDIDYKRPGRNGKTYLQPCLESHNPIDIIFLMLGINDLKIEFHRSAAEVSEAIGRLVDLMVAIARTKEDKPPKIVVMSPAVINKKAPQFTHQFSEKFDDSSIQKSLELGSLLKKMAKDKNVFFTDAASVAEGGEDGIHFSEASHKRLGERVANIVKSLSLDATCE